MNPNVLTIPGQRDQQRISKDHDPRLMDVLLFQTHKIRTDLTQPNENGRLFPVPSGTVAIGGG